MLFFLRCSVAVWSGANVAGVKLHDINPRIGEEDDPENWESIHKEVVDRFATIFLILHFIIHIKKKVLGS
jgi:hypothetical protein